MENVVTQKGINPFKRGILTFDDYNYSYYNKEILPELEELLEEESDVNSSIEKSNLEEGEGESEDEKEKEIRAKRKAKADLQLKNSQGVDEEDPFTVEELKKIHLMQGEDLFDSILEIK